MVVPPPTESSLRCRARADAPAPAPDAGSDPAAAEPEGPATPDVVEPPAPAVQADPGDVEQASPTPAAGDDGPALVPGGGPRRRRVVLLAFLALACLVAAGLAWASRGDGGPRRAADPSTTGAPAGPDAAPPPSTVVPGSVVTVSASQSTVIVAGAVPSQAIAEELVGRAGAVYVLDQVQNQLAVDPATRSPIVVVVNGATTDPALFDRLTSAFTGIVGIDTIELDGLRLDEPSELEAALMALPSVEFAPGTADMLPESLPVLDQMAGLLADAPGTAIEIGVHTDTRGSAEANRALSQARADAVLGALTERGLVDTMVARGFGESRPVVVPDDTPLTQEVNRRVELRVL